MNLCPYKPLALSYIWATVGRPVVQVKITCKARTNYLPHKVHAWANWNEYKMKTVITCVAHT